jgi:HEAT repeat protein
MRNAIRLGRYFMNHAQAAYSVLPEDAMYKNADMILQKLTERKIDHFDRRDAMRMCRTFKTVDAIQPVLDFLEDYGYIAQRPQKASGTGRPPLPKYAVNPWLKEH